MRISRIQLKNWRNFREADVRGLAEVSYILGPNASGKSNLLDALKFLRDIAKPRGGGLQSAIEIRGGVKKVRCLHARKDTTIQISIDVSDDDGKPSWSYSLAFNIPGKGHREPEVMHEEVLRHDSGGECKKILKRPTESEKEDPFLRRETHLEQASANFVFRELANFLGNITYVHLVPELLKFGDRICGRVVDDDPFGQEFLLRVSGARASTRDARLRRIESALKRIVPHMDDLRFIQDTITGRPHLEIRFKHFRPRDALQREDQFSDGTLRLISLLWLLQESGDSPLLLKEPELSLNEEVIKLIPEIIEAILSKSRMHKQVIVTTHSSALLSNPGIGPECLVLIEPTPEGSVIRDLEESEDVALREGFAPSEVVLPNVQEINLNPIAMF